MEVYYLRLERGPRQLEDRPLPPSIQQIIWKGGSSRFRWHSLPALVLDLQVILRQVQPDILHAGPIQTCALMGALSGFQPLVSMSWGSDLLKEADQNAWYRWATRFALKHSSALVGDCHAVHDKALSFGFPEEKIFTFPWGIDLTRFQPDLKDPEAWALRSRLGWQSNTVVLSLRSWEPVYGIDVVLRGFAQAVQEAPELRLMLMGSGSLAGMVHNLIQQYDLADKIFLGGQINQNDLPKMYHAADLYLSASHSDGSSVSLMEALGCGLPVLISDIPSNHEWVSDSEQGWFFADGDDRSLAAKLVRFSRTSQNLDQFRQASRSQAVKKADWQKNFKTLIGAYNLALQVTE